MYLVFVYLLYGLSFVVFGLVLGLQARTPIRPPTIAALWLLAAFGILHGFAEWAAVPELLRSTEASEIVPPTDFSQLGLILTTLSFVCLLQFGIETLVQAEHGLAWLRLLPAALLLTIAVLYVANPSAEPPDSRLWSPSAEALVRYFIAFPGSLLTALALARSVAAITNEHSRRARLFLSGAAAIFALYAVLAGLVVPAAPLFPAHLLNTDSFLATFGFPVQLGRAACAVLATAALAEVFVVESTWEYVRHRQEIDSLKDEFISVASHELRGPLAILMGYAGLLERQIPSDAPAQQRRLLDAILAQVRRLADMVDRMLDASRLQAGRLELNRVSMDLVAVVRRLVEQFQLTRPDREITLLVQEECLPGLWDEGRIEEVVSNLLDNAVKYSPGGGPIEVTVAARDGWAEVAVQDHGVGIPAEGQTHIFERYYRAPASGQRPPGLGLGLYFSREVVLLHGGRMWFESEKGKGTTFHFALPLARSPETRID